MEFTYKVLLVLLLAVILITLVQGMVHLSRDGGRPGRTGVVRALTLRIALSIALFALLILGGVTGLIGG